MDIVLSADQLRQHASNMKSAIGMMKEELETASSVMNRTGDSFESSAADAFRGQYNQLKSKFDLFYNEMTSYAQFLEKTASLYEKADEAIQQAANDILES